MLQLVCMYLRNRTNENELQIFFPLATTTELHIDKFNKEFCVQNNLEKHFNF